MTSFVCRNIIHRNNAKLIFLLNYGMFNPDWLGSIRFLKNTNRSHLCTTWVSDRPVWSDRLRPVPISVVENPDWFHLCFPWHSISVLLKTKQPHNTFLDNRENNTNHKWQIPKICLHRKSRSACIYEYKHTVIIYSNNMEYGNSKIFFLVDLFFIINSLISINTSSRETIYLILSKNFSP
jgi:hypothetical protein